MCNVISFPQPKVEAPTCEPQIACAFADTAGGPLTEVKGELRRAVFVLDLAYLQASRLVRKLHDPASRERLSVHLSTIETLLDIVRRKVRNI